jgi:hypothetical protein
MCCKICPDKILANNRIVRLKIRAKYETVSKKIKNQEKLSGKLFGIKILKKFHLW